MVMCECQALDQNEARQMEALQQLGIDKYFSEKISGTNMDRPILQEMLSFVRCII